LPSLHWFLSAQTFARYALEFPLFGAANQRGRDPWEQPQVGRLERHFEKVSIADTDGQVLVVYHADAGSASALALERLAPAPRLAPSTNCDAASAVGAAMLQDILFLFSLMQKVTSTPCGR
jgi:hypothetical protein